MEKEMNADEENLEKENNDVINENEDNENVEVGVGGEQQPAPASPRQIQAQVGGAPSWYDKDTTELEGYARTPIFSKVSSAISSSQQTPDKPKPKPKCFDMKDAIFIPTSGNASKQLVGICNIKFDTNDVVIPDKPEVIPGPETYLPKDVMQVILMAVFLNKLKYIMQQFYGLGVLTNLVQKPLIFSGFFKDMVKGDELNCAMRLLTTPKTRPWANFESDTFKSGDESPVVKFVQSMSILTFLRGGKLRVACFNQSFNEDKKKFDKFNSNLLGDFYPLGVGSSATSSICELIICCDNFKICDVNKIMHKMIPARNTKPNFPIFPNSVNPSNSVAIGAVFDITTPDIVNHVQLVIENEKQRKKDESDEVVNAQTALVQREREEQQTATFNKYFNQPSAPPIEPIKILPLSNPPLQPESQPQPQPLSGPESPPQPEPPSGSQAQTHVEPPSGVPPQSKPPGPPKSPPPGPPGPPGPPPPGPPPPGPPPPSPPSGVTKYIFAFDMDDTLFGKGSTLDKLSTNPSDVQYRSEVIANMKRVINSLNYVWIVTANDKYTKDSFTTNFFGPDKDFFDKSYYYFLFMNPAIMGNVYKEAKNDTSLPADDKAKLDYTDGWVGLEDIHTKGLKPYAIYAQSLLTRSKYNSNPKHTTTIGKFDVYLFDDKSGPIQANSQKFSIHFTQVTDFNTTPNPNLLTEFKKVLDDGTSKIGSAKAPFIPTEYTDENVKQALMADNADLPKCDSATHVDKPDFTNPPMHIPNNMIGDKNGGGGKIGNNLEVCAHGDSKCGIPPSTSYSTDTNIKSWKVNNDDIYSDHEPIKYNYIIGEDTNVVTCSSGNTEYTGVNTSFITWNIAYKMNYNSEKKYFTSKFYCYESEKNPTDCNESDEIYEKRMQNILTAIDTIMKASYNKHTNYVFLQECTPKLLAAVTNVPGFGDSYQMFSNKSEFCLVVRKSALSAGDIIFFDFDKNKNGSPTMSEYISQQFYSYDIEVNAPDLKRVMCYIVKSKATIFFNVHFRFNDKAPYIFQRQAELYNFMNAIVYSIRSIPKENAELYLYQNYDIVFTGDFNVNMLQRFPRDIKHFGYPAGNMIPIFFTCNYIQGQKTIISTTYNNLPTARATNGDTANYNLTNIDFSIFYPRIGTAGTTPIKVEIETPMPTKKTLPTGSETPGSSGKSTPTPPSISNIPLYIKESDKLLAAKPSMADCECGHMLCKRYTILKINKKVIDSEGVHSVMIFESADDTNTTERKFRILLGKEEKDNFYCMNTIGGKADHKTSGAKNCKICIIKNLIDEINEEAKLKFPNGDTSTSASSFKGNMNEEVFNQIFKKSGAKGTDYTDYYLYARGGYALDKKSGLFDFSFVFYGLYPYVFRESDLCKMVTDTNLYIQQALQSTSISSSLQEMIYINLLRYNYDVLDKNTKYYSGTKTLADNGGSPFTPPDVTDYLIPPSRFKTDKSYNYKPFFVNGKKGLFDYTKFGDDTDYVSLYARNSIYSSEQNKNAQKIIDEVVEPAKKTQRAVFSNTYNSSDFSFANSDTSRYKYYCSGIPVSGAPPAPSSGGSKRFTLRTNNNSNKPTSRKIRKSTSASTSVSMPTTRFTKKQHSHSKKHKTRRHKH